MVRRYVVMVPLLLVSTFVAACSGSATATDQGLPTIEPADSGLVSTQSMDEVEGATVESSGTPSDPAVEEGIIGLSARTTRGHVWAEPAIDGDRVAMPLPIATLGDHFHFEVTEGDNTIGFLGYFTEGSLFVRASHCPNCGAEHVEWGGSLVACRSCGAKFDAVTGEGEEGARSYPAGTIPCAVGDGFITMSLSDLVEAHARTVAGEVTLFELPEQVEDEDRGDTSWPRCCRT